MVILSGNNQHLEREQDTTTGNTMTMHHYRQFQSTLICANLLVNFF
ncbi:MAG: hypothetical protein F6K54_18115 [Okeania sp. SIO3B5]|nr:hypothetical protein [Okeania sp. SIO3B5]NEO54827.1 hypothetical protein [Okeania sp. SIO3B5]